MNGPVILPSYVRLLRNGPRATSAFGAESTWSEPRVRRDVRGSGRQTTTRSRFPGVRAHRVVSGLAAVAILALSMFAVAPASAQALGSWTFVCKGNGVGAVSWSWLLGGTPISGAGGTASCGGTETLTGTSAPPANANGITVTLTVSAGPDVRSKSVTMSFDGTSSFEVKVGAHVSDRFFDPDCSIRGCWVHEHEGAEFDLQG